YHLEPRMPFVKSEIVVINLIVLDGIRSTELKRTVPQWADPQRNVERSAILVLACLWAIKRAKPEISNIVVFSFDQLRHVAVMGYCHSAPDVADYVVRQMAVNAIVEELAELRCWIWIILSGERLK